MPAGDWKLNHMEFNTSNLGCIGGECIAKVPEVCGNNLSVRTQIRRKRMEEDHELCNTEEAHVIHKLCAIWR